MGASNVLHGGPALGRPPDRGRGDGWSAERLEDDAVALGELDQRSKLVGVGIGVELEGKTDLAKAHRSVLGDAQRAAEVEVALDLHLARADLDAERGRDGVER